ncbi:unnamed protein product [Trifolium pratense]|uniref:Uncharacterized protein n=1 Tax=Trifolium pratense TaxID=57577 RepID=A0ACB0KJS3_TRIPR|nr:unnamed protein product [Trifolium pratense]
MQCSYDTKGNSVPTILMLMQDRLYSQGELKESLKKVDFTWMNSIMAMIKDPEVDKAFGWVLEMEHHQRKLILPKKVQSLNGHLFCLREVARLLYCIIRNPLLVLMLKLLVVLP